MTGWVKLVWLFHGLREYRLPVFPHSSLHLRMRPEVAGSADIQHHKIYSGQILAGNIQQYKGYVSQRRDADVQEQQHLFGDDAEDAALLLLFRG